MRYPGPYFIGLTAMGGWDPTLTFDPKPQLNRVIAGKAIRQLRSDGSSFAEVDFVEGAGSPLRIVSMSDFMQRFSQRMVVLNGIDIATNNHEVGLQLLGCGKSSEALPSFSAMVAAKVSETYQVPVAFIGGGGGGYEFTDSIVPLSRLSQRALLELAYTDRWSTSEPYTFLPPAVERQVLEARTRSLNQQLALAGPPLKSAALRALSDARQRSSSLRLLAESLPSGSVAATAEAYFPHLAPQASRFADLTGAMQQVEMTLRAFQQGMAASATVDFGQFDTHSNHDPEQQRQAGRLLLLIQYLLERAQVLGLTDQLYVAVTSDLGRTPGYNDNGGKDHWNVTSALLVAPPGKLETAGRVLGASDANHRPMAVNARGQAVALGSANSTRLKATHLHRALRQEFGLTGTDLDRRFSLPDDVVQVPILRSI